jgi:exopolyphosphatase/guanosine-5'-triphosphate,3'-diphosphate pyrophosphatase
MRVASLDLGSNTFLLLIAEEDKSGKFKVLHDECVVTRLSEGVNKTKMLSAKALERAEACFEKFSETINKYGVEKVFGVATSAARDAKNGQDFFNLAHKYKIPLQIISGQREAELTYKGSIQNFPEGSCVVDIGGGSTEIIAKINNRIQGMSLNLGCVRLTEMFINQHPTPVNEIQEARKYIQQVINENKSQLPQNINQIIAVAGTPTTLAAMDLNIEFVREKVEGYIISLDDLKRWLKKLGELSLPDRLKLKGLSPGREDVIIIGVLILIEVLDFFKKSEMIVSTQGVRYGLAFELLKKDQT